MLSRLRKNLHDDEGFTLIELLVVIIIIGILAAIAIPVFLNQRVKGWESAVKSDLRNSATAEETYVTDNPQYAGLATLAGTGTPQTGGLVKVTGDVVFDSVGLAATASGAGNLSGGYCVVAHNTKGGKYFAYDSLGGGLKTGATSAAAAAALCTGANGVGGYATTA